MLCAENSEIPASLTLFFIQKLSEFVVTGLIGFFKLMKSLSDLRNDDDEI